MCQKREKLVFDCMCVGRSRFLLRHPIGYFIFLFEPPGVSAHLVQAWWKSNCNQKVTKNAFKVLIAKKKAKKGQNWAHSDLDCKNFEKKIFVLLKFIYPSKAVRNPQQRQTVTFARNLETAKKWKGSGYKFVSRWRTRVNVFYLI